MISAKQKDYLTRLIISLICLLLKSNKKSFISRAILLSIKKYLQKKTGQTVYDINFRRGVLTVMSRFEQCKAFKEIFEKYRNYGKITVTSLTGESWHLSIDLNEVMG